MINKSTVHVMAFATLLFCTQISIAQTTRHVSSTGNDNDNDCLNSTTPCGSIQHALNVAADNDIVSLASGAYAQSATLVINRPLTLEAADPTNLPILSTTADQLIRISSPNVTISGLHLQLGLTPTTGRTGIYSNSNFNELSLQNNRFESTAPRDIISFMNYEWNATAIQLEGALTSAHTVNIEGNEIMRVANTKIFGRGLYMGNGAGTNCPGGIIANNTFEGFYGLQFVRISEDLTITNNQIFGNTMFNSIIGEKAVIAEGNTFSAASAVGAAYHYSTIEFRSIKNGSITFNNNSIQDYRNLGILSSASKAIFLNGNTFTPAVDATDFSSLFVNTKYMTSGTQNDNYSNEISIKGNTFAAGTVNQGTAIFFGNHYTNVNPAFSNVIIGGPAESEKNTFANSLGAYITLDAHSGASTSFPLWNTYAVTTMSPVNVNIEALAMNNNYNLSSRAAIEAKINDIADNTVLGDVIIGQLGPNHYVAINGIDTDNDCTDAEAPCLTIAYALSLATEADTIFVGTGNYALDQTLVINQTGLTLMNWTTNEQPTLTTNHTRTIDVQAAQVTLEGLNIKLGGTATTGLVGITSTTKNFNGLTVKNNHILSTSALVPYGMVWSAHAIELATTANTDSVQIFNNVIGVDNEGENNIFGRGIYLGSGSFNGAKANIYDNEILAYYTVQLVSTTGNSMVNNNTLNGIAMINAPKANVDIDFTNNEISAITPMGAENLYALADIRAIELGSVKFENNNLTDYEKIGVLSMASKNVSLIDNSFTPSATATDFISTMVNTKLMTNGTQGTTYANSIILKGNEFFAGAVNEGEALVFADHYGVGTVAFENVVVGGAATDDHNVFDSNLGVYIALDNTEGASDQISLWEGYAVTTTRPVSANIVALINNNAYNQPSREAIEVKNIDSLDITRLGRVILGESGVSVDQIAFMNISLYPNPTSQFVTINGDFTAAVNISVIDLLGNTILENSLKAGEKIDVSHLSSGAYLLNLDGNGVKKTIRFIKK